MTRTEKVCVDLDGVLAQYDGWKGVEHIGEPIPGAQDFTRQLADKYLVIVYTTRCNHEVNEGKTRSELLALVRDWLTRHGFVWHQIYMGAGKPLCKAFIDDRAISCRPQVHGGEFQQALDQLDEL